MKLLIGLLLMCCSHNPPAPREVIKNYPCVSSCGMLLEQPGNGAIDCATIDEQELVVLTEADKVFCKTDFRFCMPYSCSQLFGWQVEADTAEIMIAAIDIGLPDGGVHTDVRTPVIGLSKCRSKVVWIGKADYWTQGSYPHEILHIIQDCEGQGPETAEDRHHGTGHEGWTEGGIFSFIEQFRSGILP